MSQRKLIVVLGLVALVALSAGVSQASLSRVEGMNLTLPTLSQFTDDYANIYYYPTSVVRQNNLVLAEVGNNPDGDVNRVAFDNQSFTVVRNFPRFGAIAFQMKGSALNNQEVSSSLNNEQLDAIWGRAFTKIDVAVRLDITNSKTEFSTSTGGVTTGYKNLGSSFNGFAPFPFGAALFPNEILDTGVELNTWGITPAIAIHLNGDDRVEGAVTVRKYTLDRTQQNSTAGSVLESWQDAGNTSYSVLARAVLNQGDKHVWYPAGWYVNDDLGWTVTNAGNVAGVTRSADETYKFYGIGISDNMKVNENNLLLWGVQVSQFKHEYSRGDNNTGLGPGNIRTLTEKTTQFPVVFAAIETDATKWLKIRMGASRAMVTTNDESATFGAATPPPGPTTTTTKTRSNDFRFGLGTGIRWNNLDIDMTLNQEFPLSGGYILSGNQATPFTRVSATYHF